MTREKISVPRRVTLLPEGISIQWDDGHESMYTHRSMRLACLCAICVGEWPNQHSVDESSVPADVCALDHQAVGRYGLQFLWSDTHHEGIYPYRLLRELCPCPVCAVERASERD
jgi:DUF971 family protein